MVAGFLFDAKKGHILLDFQGKNEDYPARRPASNCSSAALRV